MIGSHGFIKNFTELPGEAKFLKKCRYIYFRRFVQENHYKCDDLIGLFKNVKMVRKIRGLFDSFRLLKVWYRHLCRISKCINIQKFGESHRLEWSLSKKFRNVKSHYVFLSFTPKRVYRSYQELERLEVDFKRGELPLNYIKRLRKLKTLFLYTVMNQDSLNAIESLALLSQRRCLNCKLILVQNPTQDFIFPKVGNLQITTLIITLFRSSWISHILNEGQNLPFLENFTLLFIIDQTGDVPYQSLSKIILFKKLKKFTIQGKTTNFCTIGLYGNLEFPTSLNELCIQCLYNTSPNKVEVSKAMKKFGTQVSTLNNLKKFFVSISVELLQIFSSVLREMKYLEEFDFTITPLADTKKDGCLFNLEEIIPPEMNQLYSISIKANSLLFSPLKFSMDRITHIVLNDWTDQSDSNITNLNDILAACPLIEVFKSYHKESFTKTQAKARIKLINERSRTLTSIVMTMKGKSFLDDDILLEAMIATLMNLPRLESTEIYASEKSLKGIIDNPILKIPRNALRIDVTLQFRNVIYKKERYSVPKVIFVTEQ